jgi:hypothetical protein
MLYGIVIGAVIVIGLVIWYEKRKPYIEREETGLKASAGDLAKKAADTVTGTVEDAAKKVS